MGILSRFSDIISANINSLLDKAEDPVKMINKYLIDAREDLAEVKKETTEVMAEETRAQRKVDNNLAEVARYAELSKKALKAGNDAFVLAEIKRVREACGEHILKVIIETCLLSRDEKLRACGIVSSSGADYIKTSTGFSLGGATREDVKLLRANCAEHVKVKAAGGIADLKDAEEFIELGADRLGTSRIVKAVKDLEEKWQLHANV